MFTTVEKMQQKREVVSQRYMHIIYPNETREIKRWKMWKKLGNMEDRTRKSNVCTLELQKIKMEGRKYLNSKVWVFSGIEGKINEHIQGAQWF